MSLKSGQGKSLKGIRSTSTGGDTAVSSFLSGLASGTGTGLTNVNLQNVIISSGMIDNVTIGAVQPKNAIFTSVTIGQITPLGVTPGEFYIFGSTLDTYVQWTPEDSTFSVNGGNLVVTGSSTFGNIRIIDNNIVAVNSGGNINLIPYSSTESIFVQGSMRQSARGSVLWDYADAFSVTSVSTIALNAKETISVVTQTGSISLMTDAATFSSNVAFVNSLFSNGLYYAVITPVSPIVGVIIGTTVILAGSNTTPNIDGTFTVVGVNLVLNTITVRVNFTFAGSSSVGTIQMPVTGSISLRAGKQVNLANGVPVYFNSGGDVTNQFLIADESSLSVSAQFVKILDPIVSLEQAGISDSGIAFQLLRPFGVQGETVTQTAFFGVLNSGLAYLTWIPQATITTSAYGTKSVSGTAGTMQLGGLQTGLITGTPNLTVSTPTGTIAFNCVQFSTPNITIGAAGSITTSGLNMTIASNGTLNLAPVGTVAIPPDVQLSFTGAGTISGSLTAGLVFQSRSGLPLTFLGDMYLPAPYIFHFGGSALTQIYGDATHLHLKSGSNLFLEPVGSCILHDLVVLQIGDTAGTGLIGQAGSLSIVSQVANVAIAAVQHAVSVTAGVVNMVTGLTQYPQQSELAFGTTHYLTSLDDKFVISAAVLALNATSAVTVPLGVPVQFAANSRIAELATDSALHLVNTAGGIVISNALTVNGTLTVNGPSTNVVSTVTVIQDPLITLGSTTGSVTDIRDRGIEFHYSPSAGVPSVGFMGYSQTLEKFILLQNGVNVNDIFTPTQFGDLQINFLVAVGLVVHQLTGDPDLLLSAHSIFMNATSNIVVPDNIAVAFGSDGSTNVIRGNDVAGLTMVSPNVSVASGNLSIGNVTLSLLDVNHFRIGNIAHILLDSTVTIQSSLLFQNNVDIAISADQAVDANLLFTTPGSLVFVSNAIFNKTWTMGNAVLSWDLTFPGGQLWWRNVLLDTPLNITIDGNLLGDELYWKGNPIGLAYGGTGHVTTWTANTVVFVDPTASFLTEDAQGFVYSDGRLGLAMGANAMTDTLTIGGSGTAGNINLKSDGAGLIFNQSGFAQFRVGKMGSTCFGVNGLGSSDVNLSTFPAFLLVSALGQIGMNVSLDFMATLTGSLLNESVLYVGGGITFTTGLGVRWSPTESISVQTGSLVLASQTSIMCSAVVSALEGISFLESGSLIQGAVGGILNVSSESKTVLDAPHVVVPHRLCWHHDVATDVCEMFSTRNSISGHLDIVNTTGNIMLQPFASVLLPNRISILFGAAGGIMGNGTTLDLSSSGDIVLTPLNHILIPFLKPLAFGNAATSTIVQSVSALAVTSVTGIVVTAPTVTLPLDMPVYFGASGLHSIVCSDDTLHISSPDLVRIATSNVLITGNLTVTQKTTFTIESETQFDSGIIVLGGQQVLQIADMSSWFTNQTRITLTTPTYLVAGNTVSIAHSIPNVDGNYTVVDADASWIVIDRAFPGIPDDATVQGRMESALTVDSGRDSGIVVNWHTGLAVSTSEARTAFFGFIRATRRWTFIPACVSTTNNVFAGTPGDIEVGVVYASAISASLLVSSLNAANYLVSGSNFVLTGGSIDGMVIGASVPSIGTFSYLSVTAGFSVSNVNLVTNLNAEFLNGLRSNAFIYRDGSLGLLGDWDAGVWRITARGFTDTTLTPNAIVFAGAQKQLVCDPVLTFNAGVLSVPALAGTIFTGNVDFGGFTVSHAELVDSTITTTNIILPVGYTLDVSAGTVLFRDAQIAGAVVSGGTSSIDISGTAAFVTNGVYTTDFSVDYSILKCDTAGLPFVLHVPEDCVVGRRAGGAITAIPFADLVGVGGGGGGAEGTSLVAHSVLKADIAGIGVPCPVAENTLVGRVTGGVIRGISFTELSNILQINTISEETLLNGGAVLRQGHRYPPGPNSSMAGGQMTGLLFCSSERVSVVTGQTVLLDMHVETSYISVHYSRSGGHIAQCTMGPGFKDGHRKILVVSALAEAALLQVNLDFIAVDHANPAAYIFTHAGEAVMVQWDSVLAKFIALPTGAGIVTYDDLRDPDWVDAWL